MGMLLEFGLASPPCQPYVFSQMTDGQFDMRLRYNVFSDDFLAFVRFCFVGLIATVVHLSIALLMVTVFGTGVVLANVGAFAVALCVSYFGHYMYSFKSTRDHRVAVARFFIVAGGAFVCNLLLVEFLTAQSLLGGNLPLVIGISIMPVVSFLISRLWVY